MITKKGIIMIKNAFIVVLLLINGIYIYKFNLLSANQTAIITVLEALNDSNKRSIITINRLLNPLPLKKGDKIGQ